MLLQEKMTFSRVAGIGVPMASEMHELVILQLSKDIVGGGVGEFLHVQGLINLGGF